MITLLTTINVVKLNAVKALLASEGVPCETFDSAVGGLWRAVIPIRLVVAAHEQDRARRILREAGFVESSDGDWDLVARPPA